MVSESQSGTGTGLSRRRFGKLLAAAGLPGLSGCLGGALEPAPESTTVEAAGSDTLGIVVDNSLDAANVNQWTENERNAGFEFLMELAAPIHPDTWNPVTSGTAFEAGWIDGTEEITVPTMLADYEVEPPHDVYETYDERLTYWDGTSIDARAREAHQHLYFLASDGGANALDDDAVFRQEATSDWEYHHWTPRGEGDGQAQELSAPALENQVFTQEFAPIHPDFTQPYRERLIDATTQSAVDEILAELESDRLGFERLAENGWGSGLYEIESASDVTDDGVVAHVRDDHPIDHAGVERVELRFGSAEQEALAAEAGQADLGLGVVGEGGRLAPEALPEHVQQIDRARSENGDKLLFDMNDHHLGRLWVRRAIVALVDWPAVMASGWGEAGSKPIDFDTGLHHTLSRDTFSWEFLDSLHRYPREYDLETAMAYLDRAGYTGSRSEGWVSPDGEPLELTISASVDTNGTFVQAARVIEGNLLSLGVDADVDYVSNNPGYQNRLGSDGGVDFQLAIFWDTITDPWGFYRTDGAWWTAPLVAGASAEEPGSVPEQDYPEFDTRGLPMEPDIPAEIGSISAPSEAGQAPSLDGGETVALPPMVHALQRPKQADGQFQEYYRKCARVYNYYLPQFRFHDYVRGAWGNVREFEWPAPGSAVNRVSRPEKFLVRAGIPQQSDDRDYPDPGRWEES